MFGYDYEYDLEKRCFLSRRIDSTQFMAQCFIIPEGVDTIRGLKVKISKIGNPGDLEYRIGKSLGGSETACGIIPSKQAVPFYELFCGDSFQPRKVSPGEIYFLMLKPLKGILPDDGYLVYGPHPGEGKGFTDDLLDRAHWQKDGAAYPKYVFQEGLPDYTGGFGIDRNGSRTWSISFQILTGARDGNSCEERFECVRRLTTSSRSEWTDIRLQGKPADDEIEIDESWGIDNGCSGEMAGIAAEDLISFCKSCMGIDLTGHDRFIKLRVDVRLDLDEEACAIEVKPDGIAVLASHCKGIMRGLYYIEDILRYRKMPFLKTGSFLCKPVSALRMTKGLYSDPYQYFELEEPDIYTDEYLQRISRAGYNALWLLLNIEQLVCDSSIFPEMNEEKAGLVIRRMKCLTERAGKYGIDIYFEIRTWHYKAFCREIYERRPELFSYEQWNTGLTSPCSGNTDVIGFYEETLARLVREVPSIKGMLLIFDTEGFYTCFMRGQHLRCEHCKDQDSVQLAASFLDALNRAIRLDGQPRKLILWTYATEGDWSLQVLEACRHLKDLVIMACFNQFSPIERLGVHNKVDDYAVCVHEPSEYFKKVRALAGKLQIPMLAKIEDAYGQEFVNTPFMFTLHQFQKKWDEFLRFECLGFMANYNHYGFYPGPCADLMKANCFAEEGIRQMDENDRIDRTIVQNYGYDGLALLREASGHFSRAMSDCFPYSPGVCRYPGPIQSAPSQPFYLDKDRKVRRQRARGNVKDLEWTRLRDWSSLEIEDNLRWDDSLVYRCLQEFCNQYGLGIDCLKKALRVAGSGYSKGIRELLDFSLTHFLCAASMANFIRFFHLRESYGDNCKESVRRSIRGLLRMELENTRRIYRLCLANSCIGLTGSGNGNVRGGLFNPRTIRDKIEDLEEEIARVL